MHTRREVLEIDIKILRMYVRILSDYYYVQNISVVSDQEFDMLVKRLEVLEKEYGGL